MRLILLRHAKSAWDTGEPDDHARPLAPRGRRDAPAVGASLAARGWAPDVALSSDSVRTRDTWELMRDAFGSDVPVTFTRELYHAGSRELLRLLARLPADARTAMAIGHNPGWEEALAALSGEERALTTCNAALLESDAPGWAAAAAGQWRLAGLIRPADL